MSAHLSTQGALDIASGRAGKIFAQADRPVMTAGSWVRLRGCVKIVSRRLARTSKHQRFGTTNSMVLGVHDIVMVLDNGLFTLIRGVLLLSLLATFRCGRSEFGV